MGRRLGLGIVVATLCVVADARAGVYIGHSEQAGSNRVEIDVARGGPVQQASIDWVADCGKRDGVIRSNTTVTDFNRRTHDSFADRFRGRIRDGRRKLFVRYAFAGKRRPQTDRLFFGTFRLLVRYEGRNPPVEGACRTNLLRWTARLGNR